MLYNCFDEKGYRMAPKSVDKIAQIKKDKNPISALEGIVDLFNNYVAFEESVPVRYDSRTGKPIKNEWKPARDEDYRRFYPRIELIEPDPREPGLSPEVIDFVKKNSPFVMDTPFGRYLFKYERYYSEDMNSGGETEEILVEKVNSAKDLQRKKVFKK